MTTCSHCIHWDADNQITYSQEDGITASICRLVAENDSTALITIRHRLPDDGRDDCNVFLITKSNFTCGAAQRRDGMLEPSDIYIEEEEENSRSLIRKVSTATAGTTLWLTDLTIDYMLRRHPNERTIRPTKRIAFPPRLKRELLSEQGRKCMYCGERKSAKTTDIDHKDPVVRGGRNERSNYQILCKPCNQRKGMQTDMEFRARYAKFLSRVQSGQPPVPPEQPIPQKAFRQLTKETQMANSVRDFKRTKYISPRQKISSGTPVAGAIVGGVFFFGTALILPEASWAGNLSLVAGLITGFGTWAGLMARAKYTGKFDI